MGRSRDIGRKYIPGSKKREKKRKLDEDNHKQQGALKKMFVTPRVPISLNESFPVENNTNSTVECEHSATADDVAVTGCCSENKKPSNNIDSEEGSVEPENANNKVNFNDFESSHSDESSLNNSIWNENCKEKYAPLNALGYPDDIAKWDIGIISDKQIDFYVKNRPKNVGNIHTLTCKYTDRDRSYKRSFQEQHFYRCKQNGEKEKREWLVYTETNKSVYCYVCKLFAKNKSNNFIRGFNDWRNVSKCLSEHEASKEHILSMCSFSKRSSDIGRIDAELEKQFNTEREYWREVLKRVVATVKLLSKLGIAFRGHDESNSSKNKGNFLSALEYLSEFDDFLKNHMLHYGNGGQGKTNYFSHHIFEEFIEIMAKFVKEKIVSNVHESIYFSLILDSTPDISHIDQLSLILRYVTKEGMIKENFLEFIPINSHTAENLENTVLKTLDDLNIDVKNCRGQTYDNASNMSGKNTGLQARIKKHSNSALFIPCSNHTLNLVGNTAAESCSEAINFFNFLQNLFVFFSASPQRWDVLLKCVEKSEKPLSLKKINDTRWSSRADAVTSLKCNYSLIYDALDTIHSDSSQKNITKIEAKSLKEKLCRYETKLMTVVWNSILNRINATNLSLQDSTLNILKAENLLKSCKEFIKEFRNNYESVEMEANSLFEIGEMEYECEYSRRKTRCKRPYFDESTENEIKLTGKNAFICNVFNVICDVLIVELDSRSESYNEILENFKIFFERDLKNDEIDICIKNLINLYEKDIDPENLKDELIQFLSFCEGENASNPQEMHALINNFKLNSTFPNVEIILRIFLTIPLSNASAERSFSVLKRIKNYLRNTLSQNNLSAFSILNIESEQLNDINYDSIIDKFAALKCRKKVL